MEDKQYQNVAEILEDAEKALAEDEAIVVKEDNPMFTDMKALAANLSVLISAINRYMQKWHGQFEPAGLINLRTALEQQRDQLSFM